LKGKVVLVLRGGEKLWCGSFLGNSWKRVGIAGIVFESGAMVHPGQDPDSKLK
jgi:hypothetical protein